MVKLRSNLQTAVAAESVCVVVEKLEVRPVEGRRHVPLRESHTRGCPCVLCVCVCVCVCVRVTPLAIPCPSGPVVTSIPSVMKLSGCPGVYERVCVCACVCVCVYERGCWCVCMCMCSYMPCCPTGGTSSGHPERGRSR
jgi:hypothetical protein